MGPEMTPQEKKELERFIKRLVIFRIFIILTMTTIILLLLALILLSGY